MHLLLLLEVGRSASIHDPQLSELSLDTLELQQLLFWMLRAVDSSFPSEGSNQAYSRTEVQGGQGADKVPPLNIFFSDKHYQSLS